MAIQSQPSRISEPFAGSGTKNVIPATNSTPSASQAASWASGFPPECSQPISAGGCPVPRNDMNGVLNQLSQDTAFRQDGGVWAWSVLADYDVQRIVRGSDGLLYYSVAQSGPNVAAGAQDPTTDTSHTYWVSPKVPTMLASDVSDSAVSSSWVVSWDASKVVPSDLYVDAVNGDDSNDGLTALTAKKKLSAIASLIEDPTRFHPQLIVVHVAAGTYSEALSGARGATLRYDFSNGAILDGSVNVSGSDRIVYLCGELTINRGILVSNLATVYLSYDNKTLSLTFNNVSDISLLRAQGGTLRLNYATSGVSLVCTTCTVTRATVYSEVGGHMDFTHGSGSSFTWSGSVTGKRYEARVTSYITGVGGANVIPGTTAGSADTTSYFS